jgi:predicted DNA-binding ribbon-helix-helix protein
LQHTVLNELARSDRSNRNTHWHSASYSREDELHETRGTPYSLRIQGARLTLELISTLNKLAEENQSMLDKAIQRLDNEEKDDNNMQATIRQQVESVLYSQLQLQL